MTRPYWSGCSRAVGARPEMDMGLRAHTWGMPAISDRLGLATATYRPWGRTARDSGPAMGVFLTRSQLHAIRSINLCLGEAFQRLHSEP